MQNNFKNIRNIIFGIFTILCQLIAIFIISLILIFMFVQTFTEGKTNPYYISLIPTISYLIFCIAWRHKLFKTGISQSIVEGIIALILFFFVWHYLAVTMFTRTF